MSHTLLLADDSITIQRVIELTFADEDIRVVAVSDGHEAIARIEETPPDIVLADVEMPGTDGYEVARHIRRTPKLAHIPVLLLTGAFEPIDQAKVADVGCQGVLTKPFEPQLVIQRVRELLAGTAPQPAPAGPDTAHRRTPPLAEAEPQPPAASTSVDDYFEQLDAAFATLPGASGARPRQEPPRQPPASPPPPSTLPGISLADAFAALLAAEQAGSAATRPAGRQSAPGAEVGRDLIADALVNEVVRRVLERLADRMVRETVSDVVLDVAERLVREEIERIKGSVR